MLRRIRLPDGEAKALGHPEVMSALLHLYSLGYRRYFLYGIWHWVKVDDHFPAMRAEIGRVKNEVTRLNQEKPAGWRDLAGRYAAAIEGLEAEIARAKQKRR
jgi:hypothetical protein